MAFLAAIVCLYVVIIICIVSGLYRLFVPLWSSFVCQYRHEKDLFVIIDSQTNIFSHLTCRERGFLLTNVLAATNRLFSLSREGKSPLQYDMTGNCTELLAVGRRRRYHVDGYRMHQHKIDLNIFKVMHLALSVPWGLPLLVLNESRQKTRNFIEKNSDSSSMSVLWECSGRLTH